jgi:hypothetical protein
VSSSDMEDLNAQPKDITDMLREVAAGAQLVPFIA